MTEMNEKIINSIVNDIKKFFEEKDNKFTKKELSDFLSTSAKNAYDENIILKKKINKKDDNKPKKPLTEYQLFMKEQMEILKAKNDGKKPNDLMKEIGQMWKLKKEEQL